MRIAAGETVEDIEPVSDRKHNHMFMMRILGPIITFVDRPWKVGHSQYHTIYSLPKMQDVSSRRPVRFWCVHREGRKCLP